MINNKIRTIYEANTLCMLRLTVANIKRLLTET